MSLEQATAELENAIDVDNAPVKLEQSTPAPTPEGAPPAPEVQPHHAQTQPRDPATGKFILSDGSLSDTPEAVVPDTFDGGQFNPDTLAPELQPGWKQLQAAYTRKTQEFAEQRAQYERLGDPNQAFEAVQLYRSLQDPTYLRQFHAELTTALEKQGLSRTDATAEAARQTEAAAAGDLSALANDPELAPVAQKLSQLEADLNTFKSERQAEHEAQQLANWQMAVAGELQRQENVILAEHPEYGQAFSGDTEDTPMDAIYELAAFHDGNLLAAKQRYETITGASVEAYVNKKTEAGLGTALGGDGAISTQPTPLKTFEEADAAMLEYLRQNNINEMP